MISATRWWWVRHAPVPNDGRIYGQSDAPADTADAEVFAALARLLPTDAVLVTSHLQRTTQTAGAIAAAGLALPDAIVEPDLAEQSFGDWQGVRREDVYASLDRRHPFWLAPADHRPPNGETFGEVMERVAGVIERLTVELRGRDILAVAHGGTIRAALGHALALVPDRALGFTIDNCSVTRIDHYILPDRESTWYVAHVNQRATGF
ncbi:MAG: histidine phosphatase family protein [Alphaproteobacteria bacterium]